MLVGERRLVPLQGVVEDLGRVEELLPAQDHLPVRVEPDVAHQRHQRVEDLRDPAAERRRADVQDPAPLQRFRQLANPLDQLAAAEVRVVGQRFVPRATSWSKPEPRFGWSGVRQPEGVARRSIPASIAAAIFA